MNYPIKILFATFLMFSTLSNAQTSLNEIGIRDGNYSGQGTLNSQWHRWLGTKVIAKITINQGRITAKAEAKMYGVSLWPAVTLNLQTKSISNKYDLIQKFEIYDLNSNSQKVGKATCKPFEKCVINLSLFNNNLIMNEEVEILTTGVNVTGHQRYYAGPNAFYLWRNKIVPTVYQGYFDLY